MAKKIKVFLASGSPRRRQMFSQAFENTEFFVSPSEEPRWKRAQAPSSYIKKCVEAKMNGALSYLEARNQQEPYLVVTSDTIVSIGGTVLGKPENTNEAVRMLRTLSGNWHVVSSAYYWHLYSAGGRLQKQGYHREDSRVKFKKLSRRDVDGYVRSGEPMDKAGAYGVQGLGLHLIDKIVGSYQNIAGFPLFSFVKNLERYDISVFKSC